MTLTAETIKTAAIYEIAAEIHADWGAKTYFGAKPYIEALHCMETAESAYGADSGRSIIAYFLANAGTWRGETAKLIKAELRRRTR